MKTADLYVRVSTDEQADKGYSQRDQEERLIKYCHANQITVRNVIYEDHSAKTFIRPAWDGYLKLLRKQRNKTDLILFTKWDRFSRNAPDAYNMINTLRGLGVEPQAIEQKLDLSVPENKMMLAIYLTAPEIENDRRGLNTFYGLRRARKEGRWPGLAPIGYLNRTAPDGRKYIAVNKKQAELMKWAFNEISKGVFSTESIFNRAVEKGLNCRKNNFLKAIRNPFYYGKVKVNKFQDEDDYLVEGKHEALISETIFYKVQKVLNGNVREIKTPIYSQELLPLKGFMDCPRCARTLLASASKGRNNYYHYYHCTAKCGYRLKAEVMNMEFVNFLKSLIPNESATELFKRVIQSAFASDSADQKGIKSTIARQLTDLNNKLSRARELLLVGDLDGIDYKQIKQDYESRIAEFEAQLTEIGKRKMTWKELEPIVDGAILTFTRLDQIYNKIAVDTKRRLIGSILAKKFTFDDVKARTIQFKRAFNHIFLINSNLKGKKNGQKLFEKLLPTQGWNMGLEPTTS